jgi:DNA-binding IclR family transcriptional regulator
MANNTWTKILVKHILSMPLKKTTSTPSPAEKMTDKTQRAVQSVEVGGRLLLALANSGAPLVLKDLAARADLTPSRAHPYLVSYGRLGLIEQDTTGRYDLGPAALKIGLACLQRLDPLKAADPVIRALAAETGHMVALAVWGNFGPTVVRLIDAQQPLHVAMRIGTVLSLFDTATGRAFASAMPIDRLKEAIAGPLGGFIPADTFKARVKELAVFQAEVKAHGLTRAIGSPIPGVNALSAPAYDMAGAPALVLTVIDHQDRLSSAWHTPVAKALREAAMDITTRLGGQRP